MTGARTGKKVRVLLQTEDEVVAKSGYCPFKHARERGVVVQYEEYDGALGHSRPGDRTTPARVWLADVMGRDQARATLAHEMEHLERFWRDGYWPDGKDDSHEREIDEGASRRLITDEMFLDPYTWLYALAARWRVDPAMVAARVRVATQDGDTRRLLQRLRAWS